MAQTRDKDGKFSSTGSETGESMDQFVSRRENGRLKDAGPDVDFRASGLSTIKASPKDAQEAKKLYRRDARMAKLSGNVKPAGPSGLGSKIVKPKK